MQPENVDEVEIEGVDVELSYEILPDVTLFANYNYNETRDANADEILDGYPRNSGSVGFRGSRRLGEDWRVLGSYAARYRGDYTSSSWGAPPLVETVGDYWFHTASLGLEWRRMFSLKADVFNLFNDRAKTDVDKFLPERNYLIGVSYTYAF